jgi:tetratricopeptide (TPR) repeat protein
MKTSLIIPATLAAVFVMGLAFEWMPLFALEPAKASTDPVAAAERQLDSGHADAAISALHAVLATDGSNGAAHLTLCRAFYAEAHADEAETECEAAVERLHSSAAEDWMGRVYGMKANEYGPLSGLAYARKVRSAFEAAVALNPQDAAAVADLGEYYVSAPAVIGGGVDKANALADRSAATLPQTAYRLHALAAQKAGDYGTAEREFRAAAGVANHADAWMDLADFFGHRNEFDRMLDALQRGVAVDRASGPSIVDAAEILISFHQHPELSEQWFRAYLGGMAQTDAAPVFKVKTSLARLLKERGDTAGARIQLTQALALASSYVPAQKALNSL